MTKKAREPFEALSLAINKTARFTGVGRSWATEGSGSSSG